MSVATFNPALCREGFPTDYCLLSTSSMPEIQLNAARLYYESRGEGPPVVLIPGFGNGLWIWFKQREELARRFRVVAFDPRGVARSGGRDEAFTIAELADDVAALLDALGVESAHRSAASSRRSSRSSIRSGRAASSSPALAPAGAATSRPRPRRSRPSPRRRD